MTLEYLRNELYGRTFPEQVQINPDQVVVDVELFLHVQFIECENWKKDITKCPAYVRLVRFYEAVSKVEEKDNLSD